MRARIGLSAARRRARAARGSARARVGAGCCAAGSVRRRLGAGAGSLRARARRARARGLRARRALGVRLAPAATARAPARSSQSSTAMLTRSLLHSACHLHIPDIAEVASLARGVDPRILPEPRPRDGASTTGRLVRGRNGAAPGGLLGDGRLVATGTARAERVARRRGDRLVMTGIASRAVAGAGFGAASRPRSRRRARLVQRGRPSPRRQCSRDLSSVQHATFLSRHDESGIADRGVEGPESAGT